MILTVNKKCLAITAGALLAAACATYSTRQATSQALDRILTGDQRSEENRARDRYRHPKATLLFFGIRPEMSVLEVWPEPGWYTEVLAPLLADKGRYYAGVIAPDPKSQYITRRLDDFRKKLAARPEIYGQVAVVTFAL